MLIYEKMVDAIKFKIVNGLTTKRNEKIFHQNIYNVRRAGLKYAMNQDELNEYVECKTSILHFADLLGLNLHGFQKEVLKNMDEKRFLIWIKSRQIGSIIVQGIFLLHKLMFEKDYKIALVANKSMTCIELIDKIKELYLKLPFHLKNGVNIWNQKKIIFENNNKILCYVRCLIPNSDIDLFHFNDFSHIPSNIIENYYSSIVSNPNIRIIIASGPNGYNLFHDLVSNADKKLNMYDIIRTYWWEVPNRDMEWKQEQIRKLCSKIAFLQEYELCFIN
jgi:hypothetical protein